MNVQIKKFINICTPLMSIINKYNKIWETEKTYNELIEESPFKGQVKWKIEKLSNYWNSLNQAENTTTNTGTHAL